MTTQHTPGPWTLNGSDIEGDGMTVVTITDYRTLTPRQTANAHLIAAAPEMLAALRRCVEALEARMPNATVLPDARSAIARATGT